MEKETEISNMKPDILDIPVDTSDKKREIKSKDKNMKYNQVRQGSLILGNLKKLLLSFSS